MRLFRSLLMLLTLVTFSTGFGKTTADLKQDSKPLFIDNDIVITVDFVNVGSLDYDIGESIAFKSNSDFVFVQEKVFKSNQLAIITDVGWRVEKQYFKDIPYKEKLLENYNLHFLHLMNQANIPIRDDC